MAEKAGRWVGPGAPPPTQRMDPIVDRGEGRGAEAPPSEAMAILIAHPDGKRLGARFPLKPGTSVEIGRAPEVDISLPEVVSISRRHARLAHDGREVRLFDLGSTNGSWINDRAVNGSGVVQSGDRFQVGGVHFKLLHEEDVEHAYHRAVYEMMMRDGLTQVFNRRKLEEEALRECSRALRYGRALSLVLLDIDHFKKVNDAHGHLCGDAVLKQTAGAVAGHLRVEQVFGRVGGEEFAILCPETALEGARLLAEKMREQVAGQDHRGPKGPFRITCSFGVAELTEAMGGFEGLFAAADEALYASKHGGRNRVSVYAAPSTRS
jgi:two-component system, cell cycle response regulator